MKRILTKQWEPSPLELREPCPRSVAILTGGDTINLAEEIAAHMPNHRIITTSGLTGEYDWQAFDGVIDLLGAAKEEASGDMPGIKWLQQLIEHGHKEGITLLCVTKDLESLNKEAIQTTGAKRPVCTECWHVSTVICLQGISTLKERFLMTNWRSRLPMSFMPVLMTRKFAGGTACATALY